MTALVVPFLVYVIATFAIAYVWHLKVFGARYKALGIYRDDVLPLFGLGSMVIQGVCFALVYDALLRPDGRMAHGGGRLCGFRSDLLVELHDARRRREEQDDLDPRLRDDRDRLHGGAVGRGGPPHRAHRLRAAALPSPGADARGAS